MASSFGTKQLLTALGLSAAITGFQFYRAHLSAVKAEAMASIKPVAGGLRVGFANDEKVVKFRRALEQQEIEGGGSNSAPRVAGYTVPDSVKNMKRVGIATPYPTPVVTNEEPSLPSPTPDQPTPTPTPEKVAEIDESSNLAEKPLDVIAQDAVTATKRAALIAELKSRPTCPEESGSVLNLRFRQMVFRIDVSEGYDLTSGSMKSFVGRGRDVVISSVSDSCKTDHCFTISEKLIEDISTSPAADKVNSSKFECGAWVLVAEKLGPSCWANQNFKKLTLTNAPGNRCVVGSLQDVQVTGGVLRSVATSESSERTASTYLTVQIKKPVELDIPFDSEGPDAK